jgi:putative PIN family toxin of toxin-antitoxin system
MPTPAINVVLDTNVLIAAALTDGYARSFLFGEQVSILRYQLYTSPAILEETQAKLEHKFELPRAEVVQFIDDVSAVNTLLRPTQKLKVVRGEDDNKLLECAVEARAELLVSFDKDLLSLKHYETTQIVHPSMLNTGSLSRNSSHQLRQPS